MVAVALHAYHGDDFKYIDPSWVYDYGTDPQQVATVVETIDRHIVDTFTGSVRRYHCATVKVINPSKPIARL